MSGKSHSHSLLERNSRRTQPYQQRYNNLLVSPKIDLECPIDEPNLAGLLSDLRTSNQVPHRLRAKMDIPKRSVSPSPSVFLEAAEGQGSGSSLSAASALRATLRLLQYPCCCRSLMKSRPRQGHQAMYFLTAQPLRLQKDMSTVWVFPALVSPGPSLDIAFPS